MTIDSRLRGYDLVKMKVVDVIASGQIKERASVLQSKTQKPVRFEISEGTPLDDFLDVDAKLSALRWRPAWHET